MLVGQGDEAAGDVTAPVEAHHLGLHVPAGRLVELLDPPDQVRVAGGVLEVDVVSDPVHVGGHVRRREADMDRSEQGLLRTDPVPEEGEDVAATMGATETLTEEEREELRRELAKVEEEIQTLSQVLAAKEKHLAEIKRKLGINSLQELKQNIAKGWQDVTATSAYKKTSETLSQAGQKASAAFSSVGSVITKKLEDVKNSPTFKSFEEKVENLKSKVGGNKPAGGDFGEVLNSTASASATTTEPLPEQTQESL